LVIVLNRDSPGQLLNDHEAERCEDRLTNRLVCHPSSESRDEGTKPDWSAYPATPEKDSWVNASRLLNKQPSRNQDKEIALMTLALVLIDKSTTQMLRCATFESAARKVTTWLKSETPLYEGPDRKRHNATTG
jgi:hypothetical protein